MAKQTIAAPIDRPLSRAYLRKFTGWSTAYPPGMSDPTSLRVMHNCSITADGALRIRPGMRSVFITPADGEIVLDVWYCSKCGYCIDDGTDNPDCLPKYCPNCGARMDGAAE